MTTREEGHGHGPAAIRNWPQEAFDRQFAAIRNAEIDRDLLAIADAVSTTEPALEHSPAQWNWPLLAYIAGWVSGIGICVAIWVTWWVTR